ncbi:hypothetical protein ABT180_28400, partial [Streptomyces sp. NPDC001657]
MTAAPPPSRPTPGDPPSTPDATAENATGAAAPGTGTAAPGSPGAPASGPSPSCTVTDSTRKKELIPKYASRTSTIPIAK